MDADKRRALEARREVLRRKLATDKVRQWMRDAHPRAVFGTCPPDPRDQLYRALGR